MKNQTLWFRKPADSWEQALPLGNGKLGAMVYGGTQKEQIDLNLDTFWSGTGKEKIRELLKESCFGSSLFCPKI